MKLLRMRSSSFKNKQQVPKRQLRKSSDFRESAWQGVRQQNESVDAEKRNAEGRKSAFGEIGRGRNRRHAKLCEDWTLGSAVVVASVRLKNTTAMTWERTTMSFPTGTLRAEGKDDVEMNAPSADGPTATGISGLASILS